MPLNNKVFDVAPPNQAPSGSTKEPKKEEKKAPERESRPRVSAPSKIPVIIAGAAVLMMALGWFLIEPKAEIEIWPKTELINLRVETEIPGEVLEVTKSVSGNFPSSTTKLKTAKASGMIRVYNAYSTNSQPLIPNTRFVSGDGKLFRITEWITVPGARNEGGKLVPGTVDVAVTADQPGEDYNIDASTFSLPGLVGTAAYTAIYAKSSEAMSGGMSQEMSQITQADIDKAEVELTNKSREESKAALEEILPSGGYIILDEAIDQKITGFTPLAKAGDEDSEFFAQVESQTKAMAFQKSGVEDFAKTYVLSQVPEGKILNESSIRVEYTREDMDIEKGTITLTLQITANVYSAIDEQALKEAVVNKRPEAITGILRGYSQIAKAKVDLWPFWVEESPSKPERIGIKIMLD
ncbi:MAG: hypothetical protein HYT21_00865 [Candidatus Nealsonbacteria bacterium]|nr:hypothetical protein [Candidatus Nealsonbacteria bacterium]